MEKGKGFTSTFHSVKKMISNVNQDAKYYSTDGNTFNFSENGRTFEVVIDSRKEFSRILDCILRTKESKTCVSCHKKILSKPYETSHGLLCNVCAYQKFYIEKKW